MKKYLAMFLAAVCLFACFGVTAFADDPIVIGILQDTTGGTATLGKSVQKGVEDAIADINAAGGIGGKEVQFIEYDTAANVDTAIAAYIKAVTVDEVDFIIEAGSIDTAKNLGFVEVLREFVEVSEKLGTVTP